MTGKQSYYKLRLALLFYAAYNSIQYAAWHNFHIDIAKGQMSLITVHLKSIIHLVGRDSFKDISE